MFSDFVGEPGTIIDVGCGNGLIGGMTYEQSGYNPIRKGKHIITGIDPLPLLALIPWIHIFKQCKCEDLEGVTAEYATIVTSFDHLEKPTLCLEKLRNIGVKKIFLWETFFKYPVKGDWHHSHRYTLEQFEDILSNSRFKVNRRLKVDILHDAEGWFIEAQVEKVEKIEEVDFDYQWRNLPSPALEYTEKRVEELLDYTGLSQEYFKGKRCLDAGCGSGRWTYAMQQMGSNVDSFDISSPAVEATQQVNPKAYVEDIMNLKPTADYDFVLCWGVLHHLKDPVEGFKRIASQVKSGGYLHVMVYHRDTQKTYDEGRRRWSNLTEAERLALCKKMVSKHGGNIHGWWDAFNPTYNWSFHQDEVRKWFESYGFKDIRLIKKYNINMIGCKK